MNGFGGFGWGSTFGVFGARVLIGTIGVVNGLAPVNPPAGAGAVAAATVALVFGLVATGTYGLAFDGIAIFGAKRGSCPTLPSKPEGREGIGTLTKSGAALRGRAIKA